MGKFLRVEGPFDFSRDDPSLISYFAQDGCRYEKRKTEDGSICELVYIYDGGTIEKSAGSSGEYIKHRLVTILTDDDVKLWKLLQVNDPYRHHSVNGAILYVSMLLSIFIGFASGLVVAFVFNDLISNVWYIRYPVLSLLGTFFLPVMYVAFSSIKNGIFYSYRYMKLVFFLLTKVQKKGRKYYKDLLFKLSNSYDKDKAKMSQKMCSLIG